MEINDKGREIYSAQRYEKLEHKRVDKDMSFGSMDKNGSLNEDDKGRMLHKAHDMKNTRGSNS